MNLIQVQNEPASSTCPHCGADVALDQRYCLACGRPCSPVRLAFLDVLQAENAQQAPGAIVPAPNGYAPLAAPEEGVARLGRYSGLFGLIAVLLLMGVIGLLVGHWISGGSSAATGPSVVKIEGLSGAGLPAGEEAATSEEASEGVSGEGKEAAGAVSGKKSSAAKGKETVSEAKETEEAKLPEAVKPSKETQENLSKLTGKAYEKEIEKVANGPEPIETE